MQKNNWMIYGANGYTGALIAAKAHKMGLKPVLAGRNKEKLAVLGEQLQCPIRIFSLDNIAQVEANLKDIDLVLHCAGPFSATAEPMMKACIACSSHYLDITGEIEVYEKAQSLGQAAEDAGIVLCPGVGFDVIPTDCVAAKLKKLLPDAEQLMLGFDSRSGLSPGTAKTSIEGLAQGGKIRKNGNLVSVPLAYKTRTINFGDGEKLAMTIPWGDVSTAFVSTAIPNIEVYIPASPKLVKKLKKLNGIRFMLGWKWVQNILKRQVDKTIKGPSSEKRAKLRTYVWGEVSNSKGETKTLRIETSNGYSLTVDGALTVTQFLLKENVKGGYVTPSLLMGSELVRQLENSGDWQLGD